VAPGAPGADTQAIILTLVDRFTPSHLRLVTLWDDRPPGSPPAACRGRKRA
jgi:hypothetical protein